MPSPCVDGPDAGIEYPVQRHRDPLPNKSMKCLIICKTGVQQSKNRFGQQAQLVDVTFTDESVEKGTTQPHPESTNVPFPRSSADDECG